MPKKLISLIVCLITAFSFIPVYAQEPEHPFFIQVVIRPDTAYALTEDHDLYFWGVDPRIEAHDRAREPVKYLEGVSAIQNDQIIKEDGSVLSLDGIIKPLESIEKRALWGDFQEGIILDNGNLLQTTSTAPPVLITEKIIEVRTPYEPSFPVAVLKQDRTLWQYELYGEKRATLLADNVKTFDVFFAGRLSPPTSYYFIKNDNTLWYIIFDNENNMHGPYKLLNNVEQVSCHYDNFLAVKTNGDLIQGNYKTTEKKQNDEIVYQYDTYDHKKVMDEVLTACVAGGRYLAVKNDGTIWYWGIVIDDLNPTPQDRYVLYETQPTPVQLSFDPKVNEDRARERMKALLVGDDRLYALQQYYDYYAENLPEYFTSDELENFKQFSEKLEVESEPPSSQSEQEIAEPANTKITDETSASQTSSQQLDSREIGTTAVAIPLVVVVAIVAGVGIVIFRKKRQHK
ncbi:MAG: hypothetical protein ACERKO_12710 [Acetanaerobacterium sp.]